jgi:ABC-type multidrug transport system permease subunit
MSALMAVMYREGKIRATNLTFIFWDICYPLGYLLVFGVGVSNALAFSGPDAPPSYHAFFLGGVLSMASFGIAANTSWSFFLDRDNGIFYEMLTYPISRATFLFGKVLFNVLVALVQAIVTVALAAALLEVRVRPDLLPLAAVTVVVGTSGWFFFYAVFALWMRRNDAFNTVTSIFYFFFLFVSSMFYPLEPLPAALRSVGYANPITWHTDVMRFTTIGLGDPAWIALEAVAFVGFSALAFLAAHAVLARQE